MKIISKHKDYYDYLVGIYGEDPLKILDRRDVNTSEDIYSIYFCGKIYIKGIPKYIRKSYDNKLRYAEKENRYFISDYYDIEVIYKDEEVVWFSISEVEWNRRGRVKIDFNKIDKPYCSLPDLSYPILKNIGFNKVMDAIEVYIAIENYISKKDAQVDSNPDNMIRYEQKGFDKKESFRNRPS
jgi:hypothetical protein